MNALEGVRIADLSWLLAGAGGSKILAAYGAEVIRIEWRDKLDFLRFQRDTAARRPDENNRQSGFAPTIQANQASPNQSGNFNDINAGKLGISLNLNTADGKNLFKKLAAISNVVIENFTATQMESWGLGYDVLKKIRPDIIYIQASGFGYQGPYRDHRLYGPTAQAISGITCQSGLPEPMPPAGWGFSYLDHQGGAMVALATLMALQYQRRTGKGMWIDLAQAATGIFLTGTAVLDESANGRSYQRVGNASPYKAAVPHNVYPCAGNDVGHDRWIAIAVTTEDEWKALVRAMGSPAWAVDPALATMAGRLERQHEVDQHLAAWTRNQEPFELMYLLQEHGVPAGVCQTAADKVNRDPQLKARGFLVELQHSETGLWPYQSMPVHLSETPSFAGKRTNRAGPCYGEDNEYVYTKLLGLTPQELESLQNANVI